jgi:hypothetical protein
MYGIIMRQTGQYADFEAQYGVPRPRYCAYRVTRQETRSHEGRLLADQHPRFGRRLSTGERGIRISDVHCGQVRFLPKLKLLQALVIAQNVQGDGALFAQIDRVEQARADLQKASTHLMLQVRNEMDTDQISRFDASR